jgi:hypothetical protein
VLLPKRILTRENAPPFRTFELPVSVPKLQFARPAPLSTRPRLVGRKATARPVVETKPPSWNFGWTAVAPRPCSVEPEPISEMLRPVVESRSHHSLRYRSEYAGRERETLFRHGASYIASLSVDELASVPNWIQDGFRHTREHAANLFQRVWRKETKHRVIWDSGASLSISPCRADFVGPVEPAPGSVYVGLSDQHATSVPLVLNLETGSITPQFHVVFDDWFATVASDPAELPDFDTAAWYQLFGESAYQYIPTDDDTPETPPDAPPARESIVREAVDRHSPPAPLPVPPPPMLPTPTPAATPTPKTPPVPPREPPLSREQPPAPVPVPDPVPAPTLLPPPPSLPTPPPTPRAPASPIAASPRPPRERTQAATQSPLVQDEQLRRSSRAPPDRFGYDGSQRAGYIANFAPLYAAFRIRQRPRGTIPTAPSPQPPTPASLTHQPSPPANSPQPSPLPQATQSL